MFSRTLSFICIGYVGSTLASLCAQSSLLPSPFLTAGPSGSIAQNLPVGEHEFAGVISLGKETLVGIVDHSAKKSFWIPIGSTVEGIQALSYDPHRDTAMIRVRGETKTLTIRPATSHGEGFVPAPALAATSSGPIAEPTTRAEQEREARMLVSDLLEIGMQQRKAYEQANAAKANGTAAPNAPVATPAKAK